MYFDNQALTKAGITDPPLRESYDLCRRLLLAYEGRVWEGAWLVLLPPHLRPATWAWYGLLRWTDQIVDGGDPATQATEFHTWRTRVLADVRAGHSDHPILRAVLHTMHTFDVDPGLIEAFLDAHRMDLTVTEYPTYRDLQPYLAGIMGAPFRIGLAFLGPPTDDIVTCVDALAEATQLTDIVRDIGEDLRLGRLYLPLEELAAFGVTRVDLEQRRVSPAIRELVRFEIDRIRRLAADGMPMIDMVPPAIQIAVRAGIVGLQDSLDELERHDYDVFTPRPWVSLARSPRLLLRTALSLARAHPVRTSVSLVGARLRQGPGLPVLPPVPGNRRTGGAPANR